MKETKICTHIYYMIQVSKIDKTDNTFNFDTVILFQRL